MWRHLIKRPNWEKVKRRALFGPSIAPCAHNRCGSLTDLYYAETDWIACRAYACAKHCEVVTLKQRPFWNSQKKNKFAYNIQMWCTLWIRDFHSSPSVSLFLKLVYAHSVILFIVYNMQVDNLPPCEFQNGVHWLTQSTLFPSASFTGLCLWDWGWLTPTINLRLFLNAWY